MPDDDSWKSAPYEVLDLNCRQTFAIRYWIEATKGTQYGPATLGEIASAPDAALIRKNYAGKTTVRQIRREIERYRRNPA